MNNSAALQGATQTNVITSGNLCKVSFEVKNYVNGIVNLRHPLNENVSANGVYNFVGNANDTKVFIRGADTTNNFEITNISVKEITDDTDLPRINYSGFSYQDALGSEEIVNGDFSNGSANWTISGSNLSIANGKGISTGSNFGAQFKQTILQTNKTYKLTFDIVDYTSGAIGLTANYYGEQNIFSSIGTHTADFTSLNQTELRLYSENFIGSIDNVSVKEVLGQEVVPDSGCGSWLLEPQSTNLVTYSEDFSQWNNYITTPTLNSATSPSGDVNSAKLTSTGVFGSLNLTISKSSSALNYTQSVFIKGVNYSIVNLISYGSSSANRAQVSFDLSDGSVSSAASVNGAYSNPSESIEDYGNGWYRISLSFTSDTSVEVRPHIQFPVQMTSDDYVLLWGAQLEQQSYATSYIPTNGATSTRLQDIATNSGNSTLINSTEGVLYAEIAALANDGVGKYYSISNGTSSNRIRIGYSFTDNTIRALVISQGSNVFDYTHTISDVKSLSKVGFSYKQNEFSFWIDGVKVHTDTSGNTPINLSRLSFDDGKEVGTGGYFFGKAKALAVFKEALTDAQLQSLTTI